MAPLWSVTRSDVCLLHRVEPAGGEAISTSTYFPSQSRIYAYVEAPTYGNTSEPRTVCDLRIRALAPEQDAAISSPGAVQGGIRATRQRRQVLRSRGQPGENRATMAPEECHPYREAIDVRC